VTDEQVADSINKLNSGQRRVYDKIIWSIHHQEKCTDEHCSCEYQDPKGKAPDKDPVRQIVSGVGGTGTVEMASSITLFSLTFLHCFREKFSDPMHM